MAGFGKKGVIAVTVVLVAIALLSTTWSSRRADGVGPSDSPGMGRAETSLEPVSPAQAGSGRVQASPEPERHGTSIFVVDEAGAAIGGASVAEFDEGKEEPLGTTDESGELLLQGLTVELGTVFVGRHASYLPATAGAGTAGTPVRIVLRSPGTISGSVRLADGDVPQRIIRVLASPNSRPLTCQSIHGNPPPLFADTDSSGHFTIQGLDRAMVYTLTGAGDGYIVDGPTPGIAPNADSVEITAEALYGVRLLVLDSDDTPLRGSHYLSSHVGLSVRCMDSAATDRNFLANELVLAGVDGVDCIDEEGAGWNVLVYSSESEKESVGPIGVQLNRPGYRELITSVRAPRVHDRIEDRVLHLEPTRDDWGDVEVVFEGTSSRLSSSIDIRLKEADGSAIYALRVPHVSADPFLVDGVPAGDYRVSINMHGGLFRYPDESAGPLWLRVLPDERSLLQIDLSGRSILTCTLLNEAGVPVQEPVVLRLMPEGSRVVHHVELAGPPYVVLGVPEGSYVVSAMLGSVTALPGEEAFRSTIEARKGEHVQVLLEAR